MLVRLLILLGFLVSGSSSNAEENFDIDNHDAYFGVLISPNLGKVIRKAGSIEVKEWIEVDINLSSEQKIIDYKIAKNSSNKIFNEAVLENIPRLQNFLRPKVIGGKPVPSVFKYRYDICLGTHDEYGDGGCIRGQLKLLNSSIKEENIESQKKALVYFQHQVPENSFTAFQVEHQEGDFTAIKIKKNLRIPNFYQRPYAKKFGFNTLKNNQLLSFSEFYEAYTAYINWPSQIIHDKDRNVINPETYNEYKPISEKTEYWFTRPKSAKPQFNKTEHLFGNHYAELDQLNFEGVIKLKAHVEPTGLLQNTEIIKGSGIGRVDEIALKVLNRMYITPAYKEYQNVADDIEFEINFKQ